LLWFYRHWPRCTKSIGNVLATEMGCQRYVRFTPNSDRKTDIAGCLKRAKLGSRRFNHVVQRGRLLRTCRETDHRSGVLQDAARFRKTISLARSTKARKLAAMWRRPG